MSIFSILSLLFSIHLSAGDYPEMTAYDGCIASKYSCEYYQCEEERRNCGDDGYLINFGYRFCQKFVDGNNSRFTGKGQKWLYDVRLCLQQKMQLLPQGIACEDVKDEAFQSHIPCYLETGFCRLALPDKIRIFNRLKASFVNVKVLMSGLSVMKGCFSPEEQKVLVPLFYLDMKHENVVK